jgi:proteasome lid subunit RPN8/RPN11
MTSVIRTNAQPGRTALGRLVVSESVIAPTLAALQASSGDGVQHEGLVLWLGLTEGESTYVMACAAPPKVSGPYRVHIDERAVGATARSARTYGLGVVAQVHSHPGSDTRHSDGDDLLVLMPYNGMFSLVVANYGCGSIDPRNGAGLHQFQEGRWVRVPAETLQIVPALIQSNRTAAK